MTCARSCCLLIVAVIGFGGAGCRLRRPSVVPTRMVEPQLIDPQLTEPAKDVTKAPNAIRIRLLDTQAPGDIGRRLLHQLPNGELTEDAVWRWSSFPGQYLDTALQLEAASNPDVRLVDSGGAPALAPTLLVWNLASSGGETQIVGEVEFQVIGTDRAIHSKVVRASEQVSGEMPGDLSAVAGRLLHRLASEGLTIASNPHTERTD